MCSSSLACIVVVPKGVVAVGQQTKLGELWIEALPYMTDIHYYYYYLFLIYFTDISKWIELNSTIRL